MRTLDTRLNWPVRVHAANTLAMEWGGGMGTNLVSEEDIAFLFAIPLQDDLEVLGDGGRRQVYPRGTVFRMQINIHVEPATAPMTPEVQGRFKNLL